jgi:hypothetical protein
MTDLPVDWSRPEGDESSAGPPPPDVDMTALAEAIGTRHIEADDADR